MDVHYNLMYEIRAGRLDGVKKIIESFGLSYSKASSEGYVLLCEALQYKQSAVAKLLLKHGCKVRSKNPCCDTPLHFAASHGDLEIVEMLLDRNVDIDAKNKNGQSPLYDAIQYNKNQEVIELLLRHGGNVNARDNTGVSPLYLAVSKEYLKTVELLLNYGANINVFSKFLPLHVAVENNNKEVVALLLNRGANVDLKGEDNITALHIAAKNGSYHITDDLLKQGASTHLVTLTEQYTPLHFAVEKRTQEVVTLLLSQGANVDAKGKNCITPLHIALKTGYIFIAEDLLNYGASTSSATFNEGYTPLHFACKQGLERRWVKLLLKHGGKVDCEDQFGKTILQLAVENKCLTTISEILMHSPDINNQSNRKSFKIAVFGEREKYKDIVDALIEYGFAVNSEDVNDYKLVQAVVKNGYWKIAKDLLKYGADAKDLTLLQTALENGYSEIVEDLIKYGADVNSLHKITDKNGSTLLHNAVRNKHADAAQLLITHGFDVNALDKNGRTPIFGISKIINKDSSGIQLKFTKLLLSMGANVNVQDKNGETILHCVARNGSEDVVEALLGYNANINSDDNSGTTSLHPSAERGNEEISNMFLNRRAIVNAKQKSGITALHIATEENHECVVKLLLKLGADVDSQDENGRTALHIASHRGRDHVVRLLLKNGSDVNLATDGKAVRTLSKSCFDWTKNICLPLDYAEAGVKRYYYRSTNYDSDESNYVNVGRAYCPHESIVEVFKQHIAKLKTANFFVDERNLRSINDYETWCYESKCIEEIEDMKSEKINNTNFSIYNILTQSTNSLAIFMRNENIVQYLESKEYKRKFPIYAAMIKYNFRKGIERRKLLKVSQSLLCDYIYNLPFDCTEKIFIYLSTNDLKTLIQAFQPSSLNI